MRLVKIADKIPALHVREALWPSETIVKTEPGPLFLANKTKMVTGIMTRRLYRLRGAGRVEGCKVRWVLHRVPALALGMNMGRSKGHQVCGVGIMGLHSTVGEKRVRLPPQHGVLLAFLTFLSKFYLLKLTSIITFSESTS